MSADPWQSPDTATLLAHALAIEDEAAARYHDLSDQMDVHNNPAAARFFRRMAGLEQRHAEKIRMRIGACVMPQLAPWEYRWQGPEGPETTDFAGVDHMLTPARALQLALHNERRARDYFLEIERASANNGIRQLARELADDESQHMEWLARELQQRRVQPEARHEDPDPPREQE